MGLKQVVVVGFITNVLMDNKLEPLGYQSHPVTILANHLKSQETQNNRGGYFHIFFQYLITLKLHFRYLTNYLSKNDDLPLIFIRNIDFVL